MAAAPASLMKDARKTLDSNLNTFLPPAYYSASSSGSAPACSLIALLALVYANKLVLFDAQLSGGALLYLINTRVTKDKISLPPQWHQDVATTLASTPITSDVLLSKFLLALGDGGSEGPLALALSPPLAAFLFPSAGARFATVLELLSVSPHPLKAKTYLAPILSALWSVQPSAIAALILEIMLSPSADYPSLLANSLSIDRSIVVTGLEQIRGQEAPDLQAFYRKLERLAVPPSSAIAIGAVRPAAPAADSELAALREQVRVLTALQQGVEKTIVGAISKAFLQQQTSSSSSSSSASSSTSRAPRPRPVCTFCNRKGHLESTCFKQHPHLRKPYTSSITAAVLSTGHTLAAPALSLCTAPVANCDSLQPLSVPIAASHDESLSLAWSPASSLRATVVVSARVSSEPAEVEATFDTGAPFSAMRPSVVRRLGCVVTAYSGPQLHGPDGQPLVVVGQTSLARVQIGSWQSAVGPVAVIDKLEWDFLFGLADLSRCSHLYVDFSVTPPAIGLSGLAPGAASVSATVSPVAESPPSAALGSVSTLLQVSAIAAAAAAALHAADERDRLGATPVPPEMGAHAASVAVPAIRYDSPEETMYREAYHARHSEAYKEVEIDPAAPAWFKVKVRALLKRRHRVFGVRETSRAKPPVIDCSQPGAYPLQLFLKAGVQATSAEQPLFSSDRHRSILCDERDALLDSGRAVPAVNSIAIASSFVVDGDRVVFAYGDANAILFSTAHTLPSVESQARELAAFDGMCYFSFDLRDGFAQWPLEEGSGVAACLDIGGKTLEPKVASMGISVVPGAYHHLVSALLALTPADVERNPLLAYTMLKTFLDDGAGAAKSYEALYELIEFVLEICERVGLTANARKCRFGMRSLVHGGIMVTGTQIRPLVDYTEAIRNQVRPVDRGGLDRFLGQCGWILPHLVDVLAHLATLRRLAARCGTVKSARLDWSEEEAFAYDCVHAALADPLALYAFNADETVFVLTDAADFTGVALVMQLHEEEGGLPVLRLVAAVCHNFTKHELNYSTPEKELAALRYGRHRLEYLLLGRTIIWLTDSLSMAELLQSARMSKKRRLRATCLDLQGIRIIAVHIAGSLNTLADALSRNPRLQPSALPAVAEDAEFSIGFLPLDATEAAAAVPMAAFRPAVLAPPLSSAERVTASLARAAARVAPAVAAEAAELQRVDESLALARQAADDNSRFMDALFAYGSVGDLQLLFTQLPAAAPHPNVDPDRRWVLVVPRGMRQPLLETMHAATAHGAVGRLMRAVVGAFWWPTVRQDLRAFVRSCDACMRARRWVAAANFGNIENDADQVPQRSGQIYEIDCWVWPQPGGSAFRVVAGVDAFDGFVHLELIKHIDSATTAAFARRLNDAYGPFALARTDGGPEFRGEFPKLLARLGARHRRGSPYNSNAQARIERVFRGFNDLIANLVTHNPAAQLLPEDIVSVASFALNNAWSRPVAGAPATTAFERKFGRPSPPSMLVATVALPAADALLSIDPLFAQFALALATETLPIGPPEPFTVEARTAARRDQESHSASAVRAAFGPPLALAVGDLVFLHNDDAPMGKINKVVRQMLGPFVVLQVWGGSTEAPLRARIAVPGVSPQLEADVLVRNLAPCGPALNIDSPMLRGLPPSGFFVAELVGDESSAALQRLQAIAEQSLEPAQRARVHAQRSRERRSAATNEAAFTDDPLLVLADDPDPLPMSDDEARDSVLVVDDDSDDESVASDEEPPSSPLSVSPEPARPRRQHVLPLRLRS